MLLTREVALRLIEAGINRANVTLDGDQEAHDARRPYRDGCGTFKTIAYNLAQVSDLLDVYLTGNIDDRNVSTIPLLLGYLEADGLLAQAKGLHFGRTSAPAREGFSRGHIASLASRQVSPAMPVCPCSAAPDLVQDLLAINAHLAERGLACQPVTGASFCLLNQGDNAVVIDPLGRLLKCPALVGHEVFCVGTINQTELDSRQLQLDPADLAFASTAGGSRPAVAAVASCPISRPATSAAGTVIDPSARPMQPSWSRWTTATSPATRSPEQRSAEQGHRAHAARVCPKRSVFIRWERALPASCGKGQGEAP